jgi:hypothetical protein
MESSFSPRDRLFGQVEIIFQIACKFTRQRLGLITFVKSKLEFTIKFQFWKCRSTPKFRNEFGIPFHLAFRNKLAKISSSQSHSRHLADNLILATYWRSQKIPPWLPRLTVRKGIKDGWIVGHLRYLKFNEVLLSDMKIFLESLEFYFRTIKIFNIQCSSIVDLCPGLGQICNIMNILIWAWVKKDIFQQNKNSRRYAYHIWSVLTTMDIIFKYLSSVTQQWDGLSVS